MIGQLQKWASQRGYRVACGNASMLDELQADLARLRESGEIDEAFYAANLTFFRYKKSVKTIGEPKAVIVIAVPRPAHRLTFQLRAGPFEVLLPPTYLRYSAMFEEVRKELTSAISELSGHLEQLVAPLKSLACRLGLAAYGRNNLTYIPGWGSYYQLTGYVTDLDIGLAEDWRPVPLRLMNACTRCRICAAACPAKAMGDGRVLLHAERCTTLFSEQAGDLKHDLPTNCLFGCLECQWTCPVNRGRLRIEEAGVAFDKNETEAILDGNMTGVAGSGTTAACKLASLGLTEEPLIARNLAHLAAARCSM